jgi:sugar phosphate isomerase/epimerase
MKLAVSNLAWPAEQDEAAAETLAAHGIRGLEIAPSRIWPAPLDATPAQIDSCRRFWESRGISIVAAQSLLYGQPGLALLEDAATRARTLDYLCAMIRLCARLGAQALVFGSPKNRRLGAGDPSAAWRIAVDFFAHAAACAREAGTVLVMEANPPEYGSDFVTRASQALDLVRAVNHPAFRLHLDTGCMTLASDPLSVIGEAIPLLRHFHVSEPGLTPIGSPTVDHPAFARELHTFGYAHWISIEMLPANPSPLDALSHSIRFTQNLYARE